MIWSYIIGGLVLFTLLSVIIAYSIGQQKEQRERRLAVISNNVSGNSPEDLEKQRKAKARADVTKKLKESSAEAEASKKDKASLKMLMEQAGVEPSLSKYWTWSFAFTGFMFLVLSLTSWPVMAKIFILFTSLVGIPKLFLKKKAARRQKKFLEAFADLLDAMGRLLQSGIPMTEAIAMASREYEGPIQEEFTRVYENQKVGIPLGEAALMMARRVPLPEVHMFATALQIQSETGSSLSEVLGNLSGVIRARFKLKRKVKALSSEAKSSATIIGALPVLVTSGLYLARPEYIGILFTTMTGKIVLGVAVTWMSFGVLLMRQMINFKI